MTTYTASFEKWDLGKFTGFGEVTIQKAGPLSVRELDREIKHHLRPGETAANIKIKPAERVIS